jgi:hypothetical protein
MTDSVQQVLEMLSNDPQADPAALAGDPMFQHFTAQDWLAIYITHYQNMVAKLPCPSCSQVFKSSSELTAHMASHQQSVLTGLAGLAEDEHSEQDLQCSVCAKRSWE